MIASLSGRVKALRQDALIVEVGGVGFEVRVPRALLESSLRVGQSVELYTYMLVREGEIALFGFRSLGEHELFTTLLAVNGVGPRTALAVLSTFSPETLRSAIAQGNIAALTRIPGVGAKTAQRLVLDLKDKLGLPAEAIAMATWREGDADVLNALTALGYSLAEAQMALKAVPEETMRLDERILAALRSLGGS